MVVCMVVGVLYVSRCSLPPIHLFVAPYSQLFNSSDIEICQLHARECAVPAVLSFNESSCCIEDDFVANQSREY